MTNKPGTYAGARFSTESAEALNNLIEDCQIPNPVRPDSWHSTILYSRKHLPDYEPLGLLMLPWFAHPKQFTLWPNGNGNCVLVLELESADLVQRHNFLMKEHDATYDYESYNPHVTLSYNVPEDFDTSSFFKPAKSLIFVEEYAQDLNENWD